MKSITIEISSCTKCPHSETVRKYTPDSFELLFDLKCKVNHGAIVGVVDFNEPEPKIPEWCPLPDKSAITRQPSAEALDAEPDFDPAQEQCMNQSGHFWSVPQNGKCECLWCMKVIDERLAKNTKTPIVERIG